MDYIITFLEGMISFISPCMLPMLPIYISYFAGQSKNDGGRNTKMIFKVIASVVGFTVGLILRSWKKCASTWQLTQKYKKF